MKKIIKLVAWDVYGTLIANYSNETSDCNEKGNPLKLRPNALELLNHIKSKDIHQCIISDGDLGNLKKAFEEVKIHPWSDYFYDLYPMEPWKPKDLSYIIKDYEKYFKDKIQHENVLVIGDNYEMDIKFARGQGCRVFHVPETRKYKVNPLPVEDIMMIFKGR